MIETKGPEVKGISRSRNTVALCKFQPPEEEHTPKSYTSIAILSFVLISSTGPVAFGMESRPSKSTPANEGQLLSLIKYFLINQFVQVLVCSGNTNVAGKDTSIYLLPRWRGYRHISPEPTG